MSTVSSRRLFQVALMADYKLELDVECYNCDRCPIDCIDEVGMYHSWRLCYLCL